MGTLIISGLAIALFVLIGIGASKSDLTILKTLEHKGKLCLGTVLDYDSDDIASIEFQPAGSLAPLRTSGLGHFQKKLFPPGAQVAVLYNPLCPMVNRVVPTRTIEAQELATQQNNA